VTERQAHLRSRAATDIDETVAYLRGDAGDAVALAFVDALENAINHITRSPNPGAAIRLRTRYPRAPGVGLEEVPIRDLLRAARR
jgi:plasmid stabilization system protein ParE